MCDTLTADADCSGSIGIIRTRSAKKTATDFTDYTDFMDDSVPERQQSVKSVKSVVAFMCFVMKGGGKAPGAIQT